MRLVPDDAWAIMTIFQEAQGEPFSTKLAVAEVVWRRTQQKYMSDGTVAGTCLWPVQFSGWNAHDDTPQYRERVVSAKIDTDDPVVKECLLAWAQAKAGTNTTKGALLYYNPSICNPAWAKKCVQTVVIDKHRYMKEG
jgi:spore germination cell wall hydrolase CwlJ-like protein